MISTFSAESKNPNTRIAENRAVNASITPMRTRRLGMKKSTRIGKMGNILDTTTATPLAIPPVSVLSTACIRPRGDEQDKRPRRRTHNRARLKESPLESVKMRKSFIGLWGSQTSSIVPLRKQLPNSVRSSHSRVVLMTLRGGLGSCSCFEYASSAASFFFSHP